MRLVPQSAPYIRKNVSVKRMMLDVIIALMPVTLFAMIVNGWNGIYVFLISILTMLSVEIVAHGIIKWPKDMKIKELFTKEGFKKVKDTYTINNITAPLISALIYALIIREILIFFEWERRISNVAGNWIFTECVINSLPLFLSAAE